jgi:hypothetical protein
MLSVIYAECCYVKWHYAECPGASIDYVSPITKLNFPQKYETKFSMKIFNLVKHTSKMLSKILMAPYLFKFPFSSFSGWWIIGI